MTTYKKRRKYIVRIIIKNVMAILRIIKSFDKMGVEADGYGIKKKGI